MHAAANRQPRRRVYFGLFAAGLAVFALAFACGSVRSLRVEGRLPQLHGYGPYINELIQSKDLEPALRQLRIAATLDFENERHILSMVLYLAQELGDRENEVWALQRLLRLRPSTADLRRRLAEAEAELP